MAKRIAKTKKEDKSLNLESILFNCRDYLRGSASLNDKRDVILTLVFLRFIGEKFEDAQAQMRQMCLDRGLSEESIANFLSSPARYKNIVFCDLVSMHNIQYHRYLPYDVLLRYDIPAQFLFDLRHITFRHISNLWYGLHLLSAYNTVSV